MSKPLAKGGTIQFVFTQSFAPLNLRIWLGFLLLIILLATQAFACQQGEEDASNLWQLQDLPDYAVWRYGATDRNPNAIGIFDLRFSHDGSLLAARDRRQNIRVLDVSKKKLQRLIRTSSVKDFVFSPDDKYIAVGNRKGTELWRVADAKLERTLRNPGYKLAADIEQPAIIVAGKGTLTRFPWPLPSTGKTVSSSLGKQLVLPIGISDSGEIAVFRYSSSMEILNVKSGSIRLAPPRLPRNVQVSPNEQLIADLNYGSTELFVSHLIGPEKYRWKLTDDRHFVTAAFSNDSRFLYTSNYDNDVVIWDMMTMTQLHRLSGHSARVGAIAAADKLFCLASGAAGSSDRSVIYWDFRDLIFPAAGPDSSLDFEAEFENVWRRLASEDARVSLAATNQLFRWLQADEAAIARLTSKLDLDSAETNAVAEQLLRNLDDRDFEVREKATEKLTAISDQIRPMLESAMRKGSQEAKWRIQKILTVDKAKPAMISASGRRIFRAVLALELASNEAAISVLELASKSVSRPELSQSARDALTRLKKD